VNVVIVGNGIAGNEVAFPARRKDAAAGVTIVSAESGPEYDPCSLP
jgi:NADH oxidase (H2O2-forming)